MQLKQPKSKTVQEMLTNICLHFESTINPLHFELENCFPFWADRQSMWKKLTGKTYHFGPAEVVDQITQERRIRLLSIGRGHISFWCRLAARLFSEFYVFYFQRYKEWAWGSQLRKNCWLMAASFSGFIQPLSVFRPSATISFFVVQPPFPF